LKVLFKKLRILEEIFAIYVQFAVFRAVRVEWEGQRSEEIFAKCEEREAWKGRWGVHEEGFVRACKSKGGWRRKTKARITVEHCKIF